MKLKQSDITLGSAFEIEPKRILFGESEEERRTHYKNQFDLLNRYWNTIPWRQWGVGSGKTFGDLLREIGYGETVLEVQDCQLIRKLDIVVIFVFTKDGRWLLEDKQQLSDGRIRKRRFPYISEKLRIGETPFIAAIRALREETGGYIVGNKEQFIDGKEYLLSEDHAYNTGSSSYPGLKSEKRMFSFAYIIEEKEYKKRYIEVDSGGVITSHVWREIGENQWFTNTDLEKNLYKRIKILDKATTHVLK